MSFVKNLACTVALVFGMECICYAQFTLASNNKAATIYVNAKEPGYVKLAVSDMVGDVEKITGKKLQVVSDLKSCGSNCVVVATLAEPETRKAILAYAPSIASDLKNKWEAYRVLTPVLKDKKAHVLLIIGSDARGTMFGVYDFVQKQLGVDPLYFWKDKEPGKRAILAWDKVDTRVNTPTFKFRGWFINDEDLLTEWMESAGRRKLDYPYYGQVVSPDAIRHVFEAMVRLRMNLVIPASFIDIDNPAEARLVDEASRRGLYLSMHHVEPMGVSAFTFFNYWEKRGKKPLFSFYSSKEELTEVWKYYASKWARYPDVIWQVGLRGIADRPMWMADPNTPQSDVERGALISEAIRLQIEMIKAVDKRPEPVITTTLWAEGSQFFRQGFLKIPEKVVCVFSDNSPGWRWQNDFYEVNREPGRKYGVYYHHQLWSSGPHLIQAISPFKTYEVLNTAANKACDEYAIMNVSNIREFVLGLQASSEMLYNMPAFRPDAFMHQWAALNFGKAGEEALKAYQTFFASFQTPGSQPVPFLLDGHIKGKGTSLLNKLLLRMENPTQYELNEEKEKSSAGEKGWGGTHLNDMNPPYEGMEELKAKLSRQQAGFRQAYQKALLAKKNMSDEQQPFLQTNLISQLHLVLGLGEWLTQVVQAYEAYQPGNTAASSRHLEQALAAFAEMKDGLQLNSQGRWQHWYRGDKKMNLMAMETLTRKLLDTVQSKRM